MPAANLLPPEAYAWWVPALGAALLLLAGAWALLVRGLTRPPRPVPPPPPGPGLRPRYVAEVDRLYAGYRAGALDLRGLHLALARTMREFASERLGTDVRSWTRAEVAGHDPTRRVGHLLARWEEPSFAPDSDAEAGAAAAAAREVVATW
ncbi:hypothetical protein [Georgenia thermotolerans]|uniref:DUF4129 domain-containing protein n=1 Tax=Georgenia thermotolerans TaxID=527326 RepID=A0A7J5UK24_9MICO|nr:hypothetical protein [Georgenia thermotolerans]KAE8762749.1 hypothetical protein GB883_17705 [Georgenia thermotolerans]